MHNIIQRLAERGTVLTDGAWGTQLQLRGLAPGDFPDSWNLAHPIRVEEVARTYVEAGSKVILTNTFGANRIRLAAHRMAQQLVEINQAGVEISRSAAGKEAAVFASIGPSGKMLLTGEVTPGQLRESFEEQASALAGARPDALVIETMSDLEEAKIAVTAAHATGLPVVACMVFDSGKAKDRTMMGVTPEAAAEGLEAAGASAMGANCGQGIDGFFSVCKRLRAATKLPLWMKPNAGMPEIENAAIVYRTEPEAFAARARDLAAAGATFIGGCCGSTPDFIAAIRRELRRQAKQAGEPQ